MKQRRTAILAILSGVVCAVSMFVYISQVTEQAQAQRNEALARFGGDQVDVVVATQDITSGEQVSAVNVTTRAWLVDLLPEDPITNISDVAGMQPNAPILAGEVLSRSRFEGEQDHVAVPHGLREVGVEVGTAQAVGGTLSAGQVVDVYAAGANSTALIAQNVLVTAVGDIAGARQTVTLAVSAEQVEEVIATTQTATLYLALPSESANKKERESDV